MTCKGRVWNMCNGNPASSVGAKHAGRYMVRKETTSVLRVKFIHFVKERIINKNQNNYILPNIKKNCLVLLMN